METLLSSEKFSDRVIANHLIALYLHRWNNNCAKKIFGMSGAINSYCPHENFSGEWGAIAPSRPLAGPPVDMMC